MYAWVRNDTDVDYVRRTIAEELSGAGTEWPLHLVRAELPGTNVVQLEAFVNHPF